MLERLKMFSIITIKRVLKTFPKIIVKRTRTHLSKYVLNFIDKLRLKNLVKTFFFSIIIIIIIFCGETGHQEHNWITMD